MEVKTYSIGRGIKIFLAACAVLLFALAAFLATLPFSGGSADAAFIVVMMVFTLPLAGMSAAGIIAVFRSRLTVTSDRFVLVNFIRPKELRFGEIEGYRKDNAGNLILVPKDPSGKKLGIASHFSGFDGLVAQVAERWKNLDARDFAAEEEKILEDRALGGTRDHVQSRLEFARWFARIFNGAAVIISLYGMVYPRPYGAVAAALLIIPLLAFVIIAFSRGVLKAVDEKNSPVPGLFSSIFIPPAALTLRALLDWNIIYGGRFFLAVAAVTLVLSGAVLALDREYRKKILNVVLIFPIMGICAMGMTVMPNCLYDRSAPRDFYVRVESKEITAGKRTSWYLNVGAWGGYDERKLTVGRDLYESVGEGETVTISLRAGMLGIPWYYVSR